MVKITIFCILMILAGGSRAQLPPNPSEFYVGTWADEAHLESVVCGDTGTVFQLYTMAWIPSGSGLNYITLRFDFPGCLDGSARPVFSEYYLKLIVVDYGTGGTEWTVLFDQCPSGWVLVFRQDIMIIDPDQCGVIIAGEHSLARDCDFVLRDLTVLNDLSINGPGCDPTPTGNGTWGRIKCLMGSES
ncbi:MAG: hypothetical protein JW814_11810 [Candidatus Krumholzibacteriota bacterium]|nr:hypothetical protein [Candidatus Krumholzibacteriota bacterium]